MPGLGTTDISSLIFVPCSMCSICTLHAPASMPYTTTTTSGNFFYKVQSQLHIGPPPPRRADVTQPQEPGAHSTAIVDAIRYSAQYDALIKHCAFKVGVMTPHRPYFFLLLYPRALSNADAGQESRDLLSPSPILELDIRLCQPCRLLPEPPRQLLVFGHSVRLDSRKVVVVQTAVRGEVTARVGRCGKPHL